MEEGGVVGVEIERLERGPFLEDEVGNWVSVTLKVWRKCVGNDGE